jgi:hypothetical protein
MPNATSQLVGDVAKTAIDALAIIPPGGTVPIPSVKRKTPSIPEGASQSPQLPQIVISVGEEGMSEYLTATTKLKTYPVAVTIVTNTGQQLADDATVRQWRQQIELVLEATATWASVKGWNFTRLTNKAPFDVLALSKDYNYSLLLAEVEVIEARSV